MTELNCTELNYLSSISHCTLSHVCYSSVIVAGNIYSPTHKCYFPIFRSQIKFYLLRPKFPRTKWLNRAFCRPLTFHPVSLFHIIFFYLRHLTLPLGTLFNISLLSFFHNFSPHLWIQIFWKQKLCFIF